MAGSPSDYRRITARSFAGFAGASWGVVASHARFRMPLTSRRGSRRCGPIFTPTISGDGLIAASFALPPICLIYRWRSVFRRLLCPGSFSRSSRVGRRRDRRCSAARDTFDDDEDIAAVPFSVSQMPRHMMDGDVTSPRCVSHGVSMPDEPRCGAAAPRSIGASSVHERHARRLLSDAASALLSACHDIAGSLTSLRPSRRQSVASPRDAWGRLPRRIAPF